MGGKSPGPGPGVPSAESALLQAPPPLHTVSWEENTPAGSFGAGGEHREVWQWAGWVPRPLAALKPHGTAYVSPVRLVTSLNGPILNFTLRIILPPTWNDPSLHYETLNP